MSRGYGPGWQSIQVSAPNVFGLMANAQKAINNAADAGRGVLAAYDEGQKLKNDAAVAQELAGINSQEQFDNWLSKGGINGRNVSGASIEAMMGHRKAMAAQAARELAATSGGGSGGSRSRGGTRSGTATGTQEEPTVSTEALIALALGQPVPGNPDTSVRPVAGLEANDDTVVTVPAAPAPFVPGATGTNLTVPEQPSTPTFDFSGMSDADIDAEIKALGG